MILRVYWCVTARCEDQWTLKKWYHGTLHARAQQSSGPDLTLNIKNYPANKQTNIQRECVVTRFAYSTTHCEQATRYEYYTIPTIPINVRIAINSTTHLL